MMKNMMICRCEEVSYAEIHQLLAERQCTAQEIKLRTRAGMGICQGRTCRPLLEQLTERTDMESNSVKGSLSHQNPIRPLLLSDLAAKSAKGASSCE